MAPVQKTTHLVNLADVLPPVVQGDPEVKVTRQRGISPEARAFEDPFANMPVIQADPEVVVTRQKGVMHVDEGAGFVRVDGPAPVKDATGTPLSARIVADQHVLATDKERQVQVLESPNLAFHKPVAGAEVKVSRLGIKTEAQANEHLHGNAGVHLADRHVPGVQIVHAPGSRLPDEQVKAYAAGKVFASDTPLPGTPRAQVINFWDNQMDPKKLKGVKAVPASAKSASSTKSAKTASATPSSKRSAKKAAKSRPHATGKKAPAATKLDRDIKEAKVATPKAPAAEVPQVPRETPAEQKERLDKES